MYISELNIDRSSKGLPDFGEEQIDFIINLVQEAISFRQKDSSFDMIRYIMVGTGVEFFGDPYAGIRILSEKDLLSGIENVDNIAMVTSEVSQQYLAIMPTITREGFLELSPELDLSNFKGPLLDGVRFYLGDIQDRLLKFGKKVTQKEIDTLVNIFVKYLDFAKNGKHTEGIYFINDETRKLLRSHFDISMLAGSHRIVTPIFIENFFIPPTILEPITLPVTDNLQQEAIPDKKDTTFLGRLRELFTSKKG